MPLDKLPYDTNDETRNGQKRPGTGSVSARIWDMCKTISETMGRPAEKDELLEYGEKAGLNPKTVATQYSKWCRYHGLFRDRRGNARAEIVVISASRCPDTGKLILKPEQDDPGTEDA